MRGRVRCCQTQRSPSMKRTALLATAAVLATCLCTHAAEPAPTRELRDLNKSYFPFTPVKTKEAWDIRREEIKRRLRPLAHAREDAAQCGDSRKDRPRRLHRGEGDLRIPAGELCDRKPLPAQ